MRYDLRYNLYKGMQQLIYSQILVRPTSGSVVRTPGIPPMYDHEYKPQAVRLSCVKRTRSHKYL